MKSFKFYNVANDSDYTTVIGLKAKDKLSYKKSYFLFINSKDKTSTKLINRITSLYSSIPLVPPSRQLDIDMCKDKTVFVVDAMVNPELFSMRELSSLITKAPALMVLKGPSKVIVDTYLPNIYDTFFSAQEFENLLTFEKGSFLHSS